MSLAPGIAPQAWSGPQASGDGQGHPGLLWGSARLSPAAPQGWRGHLPAAAFGAMPAMAPAACRLARPQARLLRGAASLVSSQQSCVARDLLRVLQRRRRESVLQHKQQRVGVGVVQATQRRARTAALGMRQRAVPWLQWEQPPSPDQAGGCSSLPPYPPAPTQPPASAEGDRSVPRGSLGTYPSQSPVWPW